MFVFTLFKTELMTDSLLWMLMLVLLSKALVKEILLVMFTFTLSRVVFSMANLFEIEVLTLLREELIMLIRFCMLMSFEFKVELMMFRIVLI